MRSIHFYLIAFAAAALHGQPMFEGAAGFGEEQLKGKPKMVRVAREILGDKHDLRPEEQSDYREDGKLSAHKRFVDGKLVANEIFEYDAEGHRSAITTHDAEDKVIRTQSFRHLPDQSEEEIDVAGGKQVSRTIRRFDTNQHVIELKNIETGGMSTIMQFHYDDRGRPIEARVRMEGENVMVGTPVRGRLASPIPASGQTMMRVAIAYPGDKQANVTVYDLNGEIVLQLETTEDGAGNQMDQILFEQQPQGKPASSARVEHTDAQGNWTLKTVLERNQRTQVDEPVSRLYRSIIYY